MYPVLNPGLAIKAKPTQQNKVCGIDPTAAQGYVCKADEGDISFYLQRGHNRGWIEAVMTSEVFALNFEEDCQRADNTAYRILTHFDKNYPDDCQR